MKFRPNLMDLVQHSSASSQGIKTMHPQGHSASLTQQSSPYQTVLPQSLANIHSNPNIAHNYSNQHSFSLNMSSGSPNFMNQNNQTADQTPPASNHPVANSSMSGQSYGFQKINAAQTGSNQNNIHAPPQSVAKEAPKVTEQAQPEKSQANGTVEEHASVPKEKSVVPTTPPTQNKVPEKSPAEEKQPLPKTPPTPTTPTKPEIGALIQPSPVPDNIKISTPTKTIDPVPVSPAKSDSEKASSHSEDVPDNDNEEDPLLITENDKLTSPVKQASNTDDSEMIEETKDDTETTKPEPKAEPVQKETATLKTPKATPRKAKSREQPQTPVGASTPSVSSGISSAKRQRMRTQHYQSPLPEVELVSKLSSSLLKSNDEKLMVFYKNEFLAVRNAESGFYLCQAVQNIYKGSSKIKIRWLSQDKDKKDDKGEIYTPDFYDTIDFDCILTNLKLSKATKGKFMLPTAEKTRTQSILNRSIAVEKGEEISSSSLTEEHPDGLDLSLYREEDHLKKRKSRKRPRKAETKKAVKEQKAPSEKSPEAPKVRKVDVPLKKVLKKKVVPVKKPTKVVAPAAAKKVVAVEAPKSTTSGRNRTSAKVNSKPAPKTSPVVDQKKAKVLARIGKKAAVAAPAKTGKTNTKNAKPAKKSVAPTPSTSSGKTSKAKANSSSVVKATSSRSVRKSSRK
ncbi:uncharacterized protein LOC126736624 isoform X2 [Anthonomus grandis grandis]|uniref:uncharacterized protein LOC126736624 isoform X2 n=1 Tax=Anthonomus grandis grandis TaxID=2921223 RepID=UPI002164F735|nr:uncharacterized protein LOC126736624 isoform X2 [Anthonomus grandis grandis]